MKTKNQTKKHIVRNLVIFTFFALAFSWVGRYLDSIMDSEPSKGVGITLWLVSPLVVSFLLRGFAGDGWKDLGLKPAFKCNILRVSSGVAGSLPANSATLTAHSTCSQDPLANSPFMFRILSSNPTRICPPNPAAHNPASNC